MAATKTKLTPKKKTKTKPASSRKSAKKPATKTRTKTKDELVEDAIRRPAQPNIDAELALSDVEKFARDNPGVRAPDNSRRTLPVEEYPAKDPVRKERQKALDAVEKAAEDLAKVGDDIAGQDPVLTQKIRDARRLLIA